MGTRISGLTRFKKVAGKEGLYVGDTDAEVQVADESGVLYDQGSRLIASGETVVAETDDVKVERFIATGIDHADSGIATGVTIGIIPAGSLITSISCAVGTAWDSSVSDALSVGYGASLNELISAQNAQSTGAVTLAAVLPVALATATTVKYKVASAGDASTAGDASIVIGYILA